MPRFTLLIILFTSSFTSFAQVTYQKGYIVTKEGVKHECVIRNADWFNSPSSIEYKLEEGEVVTGTVETLSEFRVYGFEKYVLSEVEIDVSPIQFDTKRDPSWEKRNVFLRVLVDGPATLLDYNSTETQKRFFYTVNGSPARQLIYKEYYYSTRQLHKNQTYVGQLRADVWCEGFNTSSLKAMRYAEKPLVQYFKKANECRGGVHDESIASEESKAQRRKLNLSITPGVSQWNALLTNYASSRTTDFPSAMSARLGLEAEFIFGFGRNKWACFIEPTYESYEGKVDRSILNYSAVELHIGIRHYFYLGNDLSIHVNAGIIPANLLTIDEEYRVPAEIKRIQEGLSFTGGVGADFKRFKGEVRYYSDRDLLQNWVGYSLDVSKLSLIVGYRFVSR